MTTPGQGAEWWVEWDDRPARRCDGPEAVHSYLDELLAVAKELPRLTRISRSKDSPVLTVGLGRASSFLSWEKAQVFVSQGDPSDQGTIEWTWLNRPVQVAAQFHIPFAAAREAVAWFVQTTERAPFLRWKEIRDPK